MSYGNKVNNIYDTFKGGFHFIPYDRRGKRPNIWQYVCFYGMIRICKDIFNGHLIVPGVTYSIHFSTYTCPKLVPNCLRDKASHHHIAFIKQWPFIIIGFDNIEKITEYFN